MSEKEILLKCLAKQAYSYDLNGFVLSSGKISNEYLDCRKAFSRADTLFSLGDVVYNLIDKRVEGVGGLSFGADPIAISTSYASYNLHEMRWFSVRKEQKKYGQKRLIEGDVWEGMKVCIVDDVATTGNSTIEAIKKCKDFDLEIMQVIIVVDREQGGIKNIQAEVGKDIPVIAIYKLSEIREEYNRLKL